MALKENVIDVQGLRKSFQGKVAVAGISLQVKKGEIFGFLGPNGSGKTTTIRMLCGLLTPDAGSGYCLGYDIITQSYAIKKQVGYMSQKFSLYEDLSIYENLDFVASIYETKDRQRRISHSLAQLGLVGRQNQLAGELSGGWKQRLALAAALLHDPKLLLLDEPTAGVDPKARREFWDHVHQLATQGITALVSTHYMDEAQRCNRLAYIMSGHILVRGTAQSIIAKSHLFTFEVTGPFLFELSQKLKEEPGVDQVISYGQALHVSGKSQKDLQKLSQKYSDKYEWHETTTSLEDVFINLVDSEKEIA